MALAPASAAAEWSLTSVPRPVESGAGVSCQSTSLCFGVGRISNGFGSLARVTMWNGTVWSNALVVNPTESRSSSLEGVSCPPTGATCTAVGRYTNGSGTEVALAMGGGKSSKWLSQSAPTPAESKGSGLSGVSCTSTEACTAVGFYWDLSGTPFALAERWNGKEWTIQSTPNPAEATFAQLQGVSCTSAEACTAVGFARVGGPWVTLAERWNGKEWSIQTTPNPAEASISELRSVSCTAAEACTAVGWYEKSSSEFTLAETWNGKEWTIQSTPNSGEAASSLLYGVSCTSSEACMATGRTHGPEFGLAALE